jgi:hypothetical protein
MLMDRQQERRSAWSEYIARWLLPIEWVLVIAATIFFWDELTAWRFTPLVVFAAVMVLLVTFKAAHLWWPWFWW